MADLASTIREFLTGQTQDPQAQFGSDSIDAVAGVLNDAGKYWGDALGLNSNISSETQFNNPNLGLLSPLTQGFSSGVSDAESQKALTKLTEARAQRESADRAASEALLKHLTEISKANPQDVFTAHGNEVSSNRPSEDFKDVAYSKTGYGLQTDFERSLRKQGLPEPLIEALSKTEQAQTAGQAKAAETLLNVTLDKNKTKEDKDVELIQSIAKIAKDPATFRSAVSAVMRVRGKSEDQIQQLLKLLPNK
jgi:hypothetical protein